MKLLAIFIFLSFSLNSFSQQIDNPEKKLSEEEFTYAVNAYRDLSKTDAYKEKWSMIRLFAEKMNGYNDVTVNENVWNEWIGKNLSLTKFATIEEANEMRTNLIRLSAKQRTDNPKLYDLLRRASVEQITKIISPDIEAARRN